MTLLAAHYEPPCASLCNAAVVAEQTTDITSLSKAPYWWGLLICKGRARGLSPIFALTQRPAESDKTSHAGSKELTPHCSERGDSSEPMTPRW
ncbi:hypothetical protein L2747_00350 [Shewanella marinintestina]|uniref:hypothetical protein n=1 Tax=Shewanella marinintestina TaxID=190305 RepID=UPI00201034FB|nr:hypothetical protein [Shewanella marinintestina]MCL1144469.1 hypothetical protein [Shewanella marinintestina]